MNLYEITIEPTAGFGTPLKGDTLFGHLCWQASHDRHLIQRSLDDLIRIYPEKPFAVFSSAFPCIKGESSSSYAMKRPDLPDSAFVSPKGLDRIDLARKKKDLKRLKWVLIGPDLKPSFNISNLLDDEALSQRMQTTSWRRRRGIPEKSFCIRQTRSHNTINRRTWTTGSGPFAPHSQDLNFYPPGTLLSIFVLLDEDVMKSALLEIAMRRIGQAGFGRDASTGSGRFEITSVEKMQLPETSGANACYCLSPCVPVPSSFERVFFTPFVRFGKHGDMLASSINPFKNPVIMADEGAVFIPKSLESFQKPYWGRAVERVSKMQPNAVTQGFSLYLPMKLEINDV